MIRPPPKSPLFPTTTLSPPPGYFPAGPVKPHNQPEFDGPPADAKHNGYAARRRFCRHNGRLAAARDDDGNFPLDQLRCQLRQAVVLAVCPAVFDLYVLPVHIASVPETL